MSADALELVQGLLQRADLLANEAAAIGDDVRNALDATRATTTTDMSTPTGPAANPVPLPAAAQG